jgi:ankyrin repeat protein
MHTIPGSSRFGNVKFSREVFNKPLAEKWQKAIISKNISTIKSALALGARPDDLNALVTVSDWRGAEATVSLVEIVLQDNILASYEEDYKLADKLLQEGASLPAPSKMSQDFKQTQEFFLYLVHNHQDLYIHLLRTPEIIRQQTEYGETLLHTAASITRDMEDSRARLIYHLLFRAPGLDFTIKDNNANTPLHTVALCSSELSVYDFVFPYYLKEAKKANFDFSTLGHNGQAIIHIAASTVHSHPSFGKRSKIRKLLEIVPNIDLNVLSSSGSTALAYAINWMHLEEAEILLVAGANPRIYGNLERSPLAMIDKHLQDISEIIAEDEESKNLESLSLEKQFNRLLQKVITVINQRGMDAYDILRQHNIAGITFSDSVANKQDKGCNREKNKVSAGLDISPTQKQAFDNLKYLATLFEIKEQVYSAEKIELAKTSAKQLHQLKDKILTIIQ